MLVDPKLRNSDPEARSIMRAALQITAAMESDKGLSDEEAEKQIDAMVPRRLRQGVYLAGDRGGYFLDEPAAEVALGDLQDGVWWPVVAKEHRPPSFVRHDGTLIPWTRRHEEMTQANELAVRHLLTHGICDSIEQLLSLYRWEDDSRKLCLLATEIGEVGAAPSDSRWKTSSIYHGSRLWPPPGSEPQIERVYIFKIYQIGVRCCRKCFGQRRTYDEARDPANRFAPCDECQGRGCIIITS